MEKDAFPSDQYAIQSQIGLHGFEVADTLIEIGPGANFNQRIRYFKSMETYLTLNRILIRWESIFFHQYFFSLFIWIIK